MKKFIISILVILTISICQAKDSPMIFPFDPVSDRSGLGGDKKQQELDIMSKVGTGAYVPLTLKKPGEPRVVDFETSFEECAPGRNSPYNEWSAYGFPDGGRSFNSFGRQMRTRYPIHELVFRIQDGDKEIMPCDLKDFRLGLMNNRIPAIWAGFSKDGLLYKVTVMCAPDAQGPFDLYKIEIQNPTKSPLTSKLIAGVDGPPDMRLDGDVVRGQGDTALMVVPKPELSSLTLRNWGLCDKRAKSFGWAGYGFTPGTVDPDLCVSRIGLDGVPIIYRVKAEPGKRYTIFMAANPVPPSRMERPGKPGDLILEFKAEGAASQRFDYAKDMEKDSPAVVRLDGAYDTDGDGYIEVQSAPASDSVIKGSLLSLIYMFPGDLSIPDTKAVWKGELNGKCVYHINVGATPETDSGNQEYDISDVGIGRLNMSYGGVIAAGETKTFWIKVPPIHRREHTGMKIPNYAFFDRLPGQAIPPYGAEKVARLRLIKLETAEKQVVDYWNNFFTKAAKFDVPDKVLNDMYLSRLATRLVMNIKLSDDACMNACSPWFYFDFSYRDHCYSVRAWDLAGRHDLAQELADTYCKEVDQVPPGPMAFGERQLRVGMTKDGYWITRPGQHDTMGQNLWGIVEHYRLSGDKKWLTDKAYPYVRRGANWIVNSRHTQMKQLKDPRDLRYGLLEPGAMEVFVVGEGMHDFYTNCWAVLGLHEAADAAKAVGRLDDYKLFAREYTEMRASLMRAYRATFKRTDLYSGALWFGVEPTGTGMYGFWGHTAMLWPCGVFEPNDPLLTATYQHMENMANKWGGGLNSETKGVLWPYIGVDWAISYILRGERDKALDYFCAYVDSAGTTQSWGENLSSDPNAYGGDQPHNWADIQYISLFRHLFVMEQDSTLMVTPSLFRRWHIGTKPVKVRGLSTYFGDFDMTMQPHPYGNQLDYEITITTRGDQGTRKLSKIILYPRTFDGRAIESVTIDGKPCINFTSDTVIINNPIRGKTMRIRVLAKSDMK